MSQEQIKRIERGWEFLTGLGIALILACSAAESFKRHQQKKVLEKNPIVQIYREAATTRRNLETAASLEANFQDSFPYQPVRIQGILNGAFNRNQIASLERALDNVREDIQDMKTRYPQEADYAESGKVATDFSAPNYAVLGGLGLIAAAAIRTTYQINKIKKMAKLPAPNS